MLIANGNKPTLLRKKQAYGLFKADAHQYHVFGKTCLFVSTDR